MPVVTLAEWLCGVESEKEARALHHDPPIGTPWIRVVRGVFAEFLGTTFLVFFCAASATSAAQFTPTAGRVVLIGAIQGFAVVALVSALVHISGGHINPAVTLGLLVMGRIPLVRAAAYILAQCCGGLIGAGLLAASLPRSQWHGLGATVPAPFMSKWHAFFFEFVVTSAFILVVVATACDQQSTMVKLAPIPIGFALGIGVWAANPFTGGSLNPARSLGPAVWSGMWHDHWVYWAGPLGGALVASLCYRFLILAKQPLDEKCQAPPVQPPPRDQRQGDEAAPEKA